MNMKIISRALYLYLEKATGLRCKLRTNTLSTMKLYLLRHFKVDFKWERMYNSIGFDIACKTYNTSSVIKKNLDLEKFKKNDLVYISTLTRTRETAKLIGIDTEIYKTKLLDEVPLKSFINTSLKIPLIVWMVIGRIQWYLNIKRQAETKTETIKRIYKMIDCIESTNKNALIIGHGFYFYQMEKILKDKNYLGNRKKQYKNGEMVEFKKVEL